MSGANSAAARGYVGRPPRVLYFGTYDRGQGRNRILLEGLRAAGVVVHECHVGMWRDTEAKLRAAHLDPRSVGRVARTIGAWRALCALHRHAAPYDVMVVGSTAHIDVPVARRLSAGRGCPLVFDPLVSVFETVRDRGLMTAGSWRLRSLAAVERRLFRLPDVVLADSTAHGEAWVRELAVGSDRLAVVPAGAPAGFRRCATPYHAGRTGSTTRVVYFGQHIPLHGLEHVVGAAARLSRRPDISFDVVGQGQELPKIRAMVARMQLANVRLVADWLPIETLAGTHIASADVCLGVFGAQPKTDRVVPFKVYTALASGRPVVTGDTSAVRELLAPGKEVWTVPTADPAALALAIEHLADRPLLRESLASAGQLAYDERFSQEALGRRFLEILDDLLATHASRSPAPGKRSP